MLLARREQYRLEVALPLGCCVLHAIGGVPARDVGPLLARDGLSGLVEHGDGVRLLLRLLRHVDFLKKDC